MTIVSLPFQVSSLSPLMREIARCELEGRKIPSLNELSRELGINTASLREQLEVARMLGLVEVKPRTGIRTLPYTFTPAVDVSLKYRLTQAPDDFVKFSRLRVETEYGFWQEAVESLRDEDVAQLHRLLALADEKIQNQPSQIPHQEHRLFHLTIFHRLDNAFVQGILEAFWNAYEALGMAMFADAAYLRDVWSYHRKIVEAIESGDIPTGKRTLREHVDLLRRRSDPPIP